MKTNDNTQKQGKYFQRPNLPIIVWAVCFLLSKVFDGSFEKFFDIIAFGAIFTWAWLEIFQGTNIFRRILGLVVMVIIIFSRVVQ